MDLLAHIRIFAQVGHSTSVDAAARELNLKPQAVKRSLVRLERHLNCTLFTRAADAVALTSAGQAFHGRCVQIVSGVEDAVRSVVDSNVRPQGHLRVHAECEFGKRYLIPLVAEYRQRHPDVTFDLTLNTQAPNPAQAQADVLITMAPLADQSLDTRNIGATYSVLCASADYLAAHGAPVVPEDLVQHQCLNALDEPSNPDDIWQFEGPYGVVNVYMPPAAVQLNSRSAVVDAVCSGLGIAAIPAFIAARYLKDQRLVRVLPQYHLESRGVHVSWRPAAPVDVCVRSWIAFLVENLPRSLAMSLGAGFPMLGAQV